MSNSRLLDEAIKIIEGDLNKIKQLASSADTLAVTEANKLVNYTKTLLAINKDEREEMRTADYSGMSEEELREKAQRALEAMGEDNGED